MDLPLLDPATAMIAGALGDRLRPGGDGCHDLFHEDLADGPALAPRPEILSRELGDRLSPEARTSFIALFAKDGVLERPWAPVGGTPSRPSSGAS